MAHGFFTVEQWVHGVGRRTGAWVEVLHLGAGESVEKAIAALGKRGKPGLFRVVQTQRCVWAEVENGELKLHRSHVGSVEELAELAAMYDAEGGRRPVEKARQARRAAKAKRGRV